MAIEVIALSKYIMLMGTASHVGKSILTTALCRIFFRAGLRVAPFKAQNMALNSFVTSDGGEMGRAQVAQAEAAMLEPSVDMNPVLLKPTGNSTSQVIIDGRAVGVMSAAEYHRGYALKAFDSVKAALDRLEREFDLLVIEGAGSPAEINLKDHDIVNMRVAKYLNAPVLLIADIDRGGSLAALVGTLELLDEDERALVKGLIINKFRGDVSLFTPAIDFLISRCSACCRTSSGSGLMTRTRFRSTRKIPSAAARSKLQSCGCRRYQTSRISTVSTASRTWS